jgi:hypothetical protein
MSISAILLGRLIAGKEICANRQQFGGRRPLYCHCGRRQHAASEPIVNKRKEAGSGTAADEPTIFPKLVRQAVYSVGP